MTVYHACKEGSNNVGIPRSVLYGVVHADPSVFQDYRGQVGTQPLRILLEVLHHAYFQVQDAGCDLHTSSRCEAVSCTDHKPKLSVLRGYTEPSGS